MAKGGKREGAGRPKGGRDKRKMEFAELISDKTVAECVAALENIVRTAENNMLKLNAITYILDQKYGKARQRNEITGANGTEFILEIKDYRGK